MARKAPVSRELAKRQLREAGLDHDSVLQRQRRRPTPAENRARYGEFAPGYAGHQLVETAPDAPWWRRVWWR